MMNSKMMFSGKGLVITGAFLLVSVALISVFPRLRVDLTQDSLYTLADGTELLVGHVTFAAAGPAFSLPQETGDPPDFAALAQDRKSVV